MTASTDTWPRDLDSSANAHVSILDEGLLQPRVSLFFKVLLFIQLGFLFCCDIMTFVGLVMPADPNLERQGAVWSFALVAVLAAGWQLTRRIDLPTRALVALESVATVLLASAYVFGAMMGDPTHGPMSGLAVAALVLVLRASLIPSPVPRTLLVGLTTLGAAALTWEILGVVTIQQAGNGVLGAAFVAVTGVTSHVIYGLRREISEARQLGPYHLERKLGAGGMGVVYQATHQLLRRPTAIKLLPIDAIGERTVRRFEREVRQTSRLEHPNNITIYDYGRTPDGRFYYAMEHVDGLTLEQLVERDGPLAPSRAVHILAQAAEALAEAHAMRLVHRDIKPANIMIKARGPRPDTVKVLDYGLVKELADPDATVSHSGAIVGTPHFLAPEAISEADAAIPATDVYALGAVAYYLLTGRHVFEGANVISVCSKHLSERPAPPSRFRGGLDPALEALVLRCLEKDPADRFADAGALADALSRLDRGEARGNASPPRASG